jgi:hypothetical protein
VIAGPEQRRQSEQQEGILQSGRGLFVRGH